MIEVLKEHENGATHTFFILELEYKSANESFETQLSTKLLSERVKSFGVLTMIISSVRYLARQGLALRGHESDCKNLEELLNLHKNDCPDLKFGETLDTRSLLPGQFKVSCWT